MLNRTWVVIIIVLVVGFLIYYLPKIKSSNPIQSNIQKSQKSTVDPSKILDGGPGKDGIPSIDKPKFVLVKEAGDWLKDNDLVMVVTIENITKAYPILIMNWHEIVNDKFGSTAVVVSYCPLCGSGIVYKRILDGQEVQFGVSGKLYNSDLLMYDRKTDTLWSQITGEAIQGQLTGRKLEQLEANLIDFKTLRDRYPQAQVLSKDTGFSRDYSKSPYGDYDNSSSIYFPVENHSDKLFAKDRIIGIAVDGKYKAYRFDMIKNKKNLQDNVNNRIININMDDKEQITILDTNGGKINFINTFYFAWVAFHPDTEVFK